MPLIANNNLPFNCATDNDKRRLIECLFYKGKSFNIQILSSKIQLPPEIETNSDFVSYILQVNIFPLLIKDVPKEEEFIFDCIFFQGNDAWIGKDHRGKYRYFTKTKRAINYVGYSIFDLFYVFFSNGNKRSLLDRRIFFLIRRELTNLLQVSYTQLEIEEKYGAIYDNENSNVDLLIEKLYPDFVNKLSWLTP